jgi:RHS repeat-associated protein
LGSTRLVTDSSANVIARHDYSPFGEEVPASTAGRDTHWGPFNDTVNQKFTGKERDSESGLDYFGARYYGSALGRFTSADAPFNDQNTADPQSWNLYSYVRNNPVANMDPTGRSCTTSTDSNGNTVIQDADGKGCSALNGPTIVTATVPYELGEQAFVGFGNLFLNGQISGLKDLALGIFSLYPTNLPFTLLGHSGQLAAAIRTFGGKSAQELLATAKTAGKGGQLTQAGRALQKHANRSGSAFSGTTGPESAWNEKAAQILDDILNDPGATATNNYSRSAGNVVDVTDSTGRGARFSSDMSEFIGFLEP